MVVLIILNEVKKLVMKYTWRQLFPVYTKDELKRKLKEKRHEVQLAIDQGEYWKAINAYRKEAQYRLKIMRITYKEGERLVKERCKRNKKKES